MDRSESLFQKQRIKRFNFSVWTVLTGTLLARTSYFMAWPFLIVFLYEDYGVTSFLSDFTFFGPSEDFSFQIEGGEFSFFGGLNLVIDESLNVDWANNFDSDGLESTFNFGFGSDAGFFNVTFLDYATAAMTGFGTFGWEGITVDFELAAPAPVSEPSTLLLFGISLLVASRFRRKHH